jgi:cyclopropane fatty-acyl-phospholipid synthase-like methyltransferase
MTMDRQITYPMVMANQMLIDGGTMLDVVVTQEDLEETLQYFLDPMNRDIFIDGTYPTMNDVRRAFVILGAKVMV